MLQLLLRGQLDFQTAIAEILAVLLIIFLILPFHEWAHAYTAYLLGDKSIKNRGRLSINPLNHIDIFGALAMLLFGFGWAKPVPIDPRYFKRPKLGMAISAIMGPIANLLASFAGMLVFYAILAFAPAFMYSGVGGFVKEFLSYYISCNIVLAVFNMIPIPPLDGSKVLFLFLPDKAVNFCYKYQQIFFIALFSLLYMNVLDGVLGWAVGGVADAMSWLASLPFRSFLLA